VRVCLCVFVCVCEFVCDKQRSRLARHLLICSLLLVHGIKQQANFKPALLCLHTHTHTHTHAHAQEAEKHARKELEAIMGDSNQSENARRRAKEALRKQADEMAALQTQVCVYVSVRVCVCMCTCMHVFVFVCVRVYIYLRVCVCMRGR